MLSWWLHGLLFHVHRYHLNRKFTCDECGRSFSTESYMYKHRLTHSGTEVFTLWCLMDKWMLLVESRCLLLLSLSSFCLLDSFILLLNFHDLIWPLHMRLKCKFMSFITELVSTFILCFLCCYMALFPFVIDNSVN